MKLIRIDKMVNNVGDIDLSREFSKLRYELLNESPARDRRDAFNEVVSISDTILDHLCKIWLFYRSEDDVDAWIDEIAAKYSQAPTYGKGNKNVLTSDEIENTLWDYDMESSIERRIKRIARTPKYNGLEKRGNYLEYVDELIRRLDRFYSSYARDLVEITKANSNKSSVSAKVGRKAYDRLSKNEKRQYYKRMTSAQMDDLVRNIARINADNDFVTT